MQTTGRWRRPLGQLRRSSQQICEEVSEHQDRTLEDQFGRGLQNCNRLLLHHPDPDGLQERSKDSGLGCRNKPWLLRFLQQYNAGMNSSETHFLACTSLLHASSCRCIHKKSLHSLAAFTCNKLKSTSAKPARPSNATLRDRISAKRKPWTWKLRIADASGDVTHGHLMRQSKAANTRAYAARADRRDQPRAMPPDHAACRRRSMSFPDCWLWRWLVGSSEKELLTPGLVLFSRSDSVDSR